MQAPLIENPVYLAAVLLGILALLFAANAHPVVGRAFKVIPLLVFAYFVPALLSNTGIIPTESPLYDFIKKWLLPASLLLLTLSVDIPGLTRLGPKVIVLFLTATVGIVIGGPIAFALVGLIAPDQVRALGAESWKGLAALSGSWIGGGANFVAIGKSVGVQDATLGLMIVVDVAVANVWTGVLLWFSGRAEQMDAKINADARAIDELRVRVAKYQAEVSRPTTLPDLLTILAVAFGGTSLATVIATRSAHWPGLPDIDPVITGFTWIVILVTTLGIALSFTPVRRLEGAGAGAVGSTLLYLLVASIGAHADFARAVEVPVLVAIGAVWMTFHAVTIMIVRRLLRAPIFFAAIGSQANIGGAASAPIVASAFHPALAPVGVLLAVAGYVLGTYGGILCALMLERVHAWLTF